MRNCELIILLLILFDHEGRPLGHFYATAPITPLDRTFLCIERLPASPSRRWPRRNHRPLVLYRYLRIFSTFPQVLFGAFLRYR